MANENEPLPYYRWYVRHYRASRRVQRLDYIQRGLYRELLDECWLVGAIPDDLPKLADICNCPVGVMAEAWPTLRPLFSATDYLDGMFLVNERLDEERTAADKLRAVRALAGRKGGKAKQTQAFGKHLVSNSHIAVAEQSSSSSVASPDAAPPSPHGEARLDQVAPTFMAVVRSMGKGGA